ncbi:hypothetical protein ACSMXN_18235 [Jatrophihabitans sp. DSM 45814]
MDDEAIRDQAIQFEPERFASAAAIYAQLRPAIEALRAVPLAFLEPVDEPATALRWIERGDEG